MAADVFKAAGAECRSDDAHVDAGLVTVGAPLKKRLGLAAITLRAGRLPSTSAKLVAMLGGNWTSVLLYRRCLSAMVKHLFKFASEAEQMGENQVLHLPRRIVAELSMLAIMVPTMVSNVAVDYSPHVFASDASLGKGAVVTSSLDPEQVGVLWLGADKKGAYSKLLSSPMDLLAAAGEDLYDDLAARRSDGPGTDRPQKGLLMYYDFVEIFGGSGRVSACAAKLGLVVAPPLDLDQSEHYDLGKQELMLWIFHMLETGRFKSCLTEPPCTTFSAAAYPALRSYAEPMGHQPSEPRAKHGNLLAFQSFLILRHARKHRRPCGKEQPHLSKMRWLQAWQNLYDLGFTNAVIASCQFGSPHKKEFIFVTWGIDNASFETRCPGGHAHQKIEGAATRPSAIYVWDLARHIALHFDKALRRIAFCDHDSPETQGHESVAINDILIARQWRTLKCWRWRSKSHINVLEAKAAIEIVKEAALTTPGHRVLAALDSRVAKGALAKGRSTARGLQEACQKSAAWQIAADIYMGWCFAPTRLNTADDPTRDLDVRRHAKHALLEVLDLEEIQLLHHQQLSRSAANWVRLALLLMLFVPASAGEDPSTGRACHIWAAFGFVRPCLFFLQGSDLGLGLRGHPFCHLCVDFTLPCWICARCCSVVSAAFLGIASILVFFAASATLFGLSRFVLAPRGFAHGLGALGVYFCLGAAVAPFGVLSFGPAGALAMAPETPADFARAETRAGNRLLASRVARQSTLDFRSRLLQDFRAWLYSTHGKMLTVLLTEKPADPEEISRLLVEYGNQMFISGKAYGKFAETINAIVAARPSLKKQN